MMCDASPTWLSRKNEISLFFNQLTPHLFAEPAVGLNLVSLRINK